MDRERKHQGPSASPADLQPAGTPGRGTLVDDEPAIPRLELRPGRAGIGLRGTSGPRAAHGRGPAPAATAPHAAAPAPATGSQGTAPAPATAPQAAGTSSPAHAEAPAPAIDALLASAPVTITHRVYDPAPDGSPATRTTVGVGETITFTSRFAGRWHADLVASGAGAGLHGTTYQWTAPSVPGTATITFTPATPGHAPVQTPITIVAPTVDYRDAVPFAFPGQAAGVAGVMMHSRVVYGPNNVSFANTQWFEEPGPPTGLIGYFAHFPPIDHAPLAEDLPIDTHNLGPIDEAGYWNLPPPPYELGAFEWVIPTKYAVFGESERHLISNVRQRFRLEADGTMKVTKGNAHMTRKP